MKIIAYTLIVLSLLGACRQKQDSNDFVPKPKGYNRIDLPVAKYQLLDDSHPFRFEYSKEAIIKPDTVPWAEPHWIYVYYPAYKALIQLTYKPLQGDKQKLAKLINDAHRLTAKHHIKAYAINDWIMKTNTGKVASVVELDGEVPTYMQFYTTDSSTHYLRGALYFNTATHSDSLRPVIEYLKKDVIQMLNTLTWKK